MMATASNPNSSSSSTLLPPRLIHALIDPVHCNQSDPIECSVHTLPKPLLREFRHVFGDVVVVGAPAPMDNGGNNNNSPENLQLLAIPTNQRAREDLVGVGDHVEQEKDRLLNVFIGFARQVCERLIARGYWADFIDPCSGLPMLSIGCNKVYSEVDGMECLLNYKAYNAGFCKVLIHPKFGSSVYPATIFTHAPPDDVIQILQSYPVAMDDQ